MPKLGFWGLTPPTPPCGPGAVFQGRWDLPDLVPQTDHRRWGQREGTGVTSQPLLLSLRTWVRGQPPGASVTRVRRLMQDKEQGLWCWIQIPVLAPIPTINQML